MKFKFNLIVYDFDGVMTDNRAYVDENGNEMVQVNRSDGLAISEIKKLGIDQMIISTEKNKVVSVRSSKLQINCIHGVEDKKQTLLEYLKKKKISSKKVAFVGNDINDKDVMEVVGFSFCPSDSHISILNISDYILKTKGGDGVVREIFDLLINKGV